MPDPSDRTAPTPQVPEELASGPAPTAAAGKPGEATPAAEPLLLVPRSRSGGAGPKEGAVPAGAPPGAPASFTDFMQWMKMFAASEAPAEEVAPPGNQPLRTTLPKAQRKFQRFDRETGGPGAAATPVPPGVGTVPTGRSADDRSASPAADEKASLPVSRPLPVPLAGGMSVRRAKSVGTRRPRLWVVLRLGALALLAMIFLLGRASVRRGAPATGAEPGAAGTTLDPEAARMIDEAMAAEQNRDAGRATELLLEVQKDFPRVRGLDYRLAGLAWEQGDSARARRFLDQAIAKGEQAAAAYELRGSISNQAGIKRRAGVTRGMNDLETATMIDPFSAENFFLWGEALRFAGKPQAALARLQQAMDRLREQELEPEYRFKIRLTKIELGREHEFAPEMAARLAENPPSPDWLLTAAAIDLQHHDIASAANYLERARQLMDTDLFNMRMRDYFFANYRFEKPLAKYFAFASPAASQTVTPDAAPPTSPTGTPPETGPRLP